MKKMFNNIGYVLSISLFFFVLISCEEDNTIEIPIDKTDIKDVPYGEHQQQKYDIYLPKERSSSTTKVFILVHGGAWIEGDKTDMNPYVTELQTNFPDYAIVNINYRLASVGNSPFPMQINDIKGIITQLQDKKEEYQISNQYAFIGISAGAHLSMLYAYANDNKNEVDMVCSIVGPTNFTDDAYVNPSNNSYAYLALLIQQITGVNYDQNIDFYKNNSPYHVATSNAPPTILFYGGKDNLIPTTQGVDMSEKLIALGVPNEFTLYPEEGHGWEGDNLLDTIVKLRAFIKANF